MSWSKPYLSVESASKAELAMRSYDFDSAIALYLEAATAELLAFKETPKEKSRTRGITLVSAVSLFFKARNFDRAEEIALNNIGVVGLPEFAREQLKDLIQTIGTKKSMRTPILGSRRRGVGLLRGEMSLLAVLLWNLF